jgi:oligopeptide/dipeptide ABC transporter ATP-binding protein
MQHRSSTAYVSAPGEHSTADQDGSDAGALLDVSGLKTHFLTPRGRVRAVDGVDLSLARGITLGIVGESGSGKTVLARSIMNLLPKQNVRRSGRVMFMGRNLIDLEDREMRRLGGAQMAMVFQDPMSSLHPVMTAEILNLLQDNQRDRFMTMVLVTHDLGVVAGRTDEVAVMYAGRIVEQARTPVLFARMRHPYTEALLRSIPRVEDPSHTRLRVISGRPPDLIDPPTGCAFAARCPYVHERCRVEAPRLEAIDLDGHLSACFAPLGTPENAAALERNLAAGLPQSLAVAGTPRDPVVVDDEQRWRRGGGDVADR